jgi:uncharacterized surface protein with fasciclin (FAS1) repeats
LTAGAFGGIILVELADCPQTPAWPARENSMRNTLLAGALALLVAVPASAQMPSHDMVEKPQMNIVETAVAAGSFNTLVAAVKAAGLVDVLSGEGPFTVFAPTDEAFAKLPDGTVEALLEDTEKLTAILTYHVVAGKVMSSDVAGLTSATTVQGGDLSIDTSYGVKINDAKVVKADVEASNGVIHVIDTVLLP